MPSETTSIKLREFLLKVFMTSYTRFMKRAISQPIFFLVLRYQDSIRVFCELAEKYLKINDPAGLDNGNGDSGDGDKERACDSLLMCFVTMMNHGLRNGGGIGDVLRSPSNKVQYPTFAKIVGVNFILRCNTCCKLYPPFAGVPLPGQGHLRHGLLLHRHHHRPEPDLRRHHRHLRRSPFRKAEQGGGHQELVLYMR